MNKLILALALVLASCDTAVEAEPVAGFSNALCPITGEPIDPTI
jgi:hypothetical protein